MNTPQLLQDLPHLLRRRRGLLMLAGAGLLGVVGCGGGGDDSASTSSSSSSGSTGSTGSTGSGSTGSCTVVAEETAGPYPGDGSNTTSSGVANALMLSGIVRSDIRSSIAGVTGTAEGVPVTITITLVNVNGSCASLAGYAIYLWHCDRDGHYSMYTAPDQNYLRGVQVTDASGQVTFTSIFPACYSGRMPHIHFEVYRDANTATSFSNKLKTSQIALPPATCLEVYQTASGYSASVANLNAISFSTDNVFSDGVTTELATVTGSVAAGYAIALTAGVSV